jgi:predicted SAM-dependent methyltransferase
LNPRAVIKAVIAPVARPVWRRVWPRIEVRIDAAVAARTESLQEAWRTHVPAFLNAVSSVGAFGRKLAELQRTTTQIRAEAEADRRQVLEIWQRLEFVRRELLFEFKYAGPGSRSEGAAAQAPEPRILSPDKVEAAIAAGDVRLNLGCGHIAKQGYINVDMRELPGVDVVTSADKLPFALGTVREISSAHLVEHFPQEALRRKLLPYWLSLLQPGGTLRAITPDASAMMGAYAKGDYPFEDFREVLFGAQDYDGDFHYNLLTADSMRDLLTEAGFTSIEVPAAGRRNGKCFEFEIVGHRL